MSATNAVNYLADDHHSVMGPLNYLARMSEKPFSHNYTPPAGTRLTNRVIEQQTVAIHDGRAVADQLTLDGAGFAFVLRPTAVANFYDDDEVRAIYYPECERLLLEETGAARVFLFDHIVRSASHAATGQKGIKLPAKGVHNDYTLNSGPQRVRDFFPDEADRLLQNRFAIINVWRPVRGPVNESPLAVCDARSIRPEDFVETDLLYPNRKGEILSVAFNPHHHWYYFPDMMPNEAILLKCYDSATDGSARFTAHTGFDDPTTPPGAHPRESIETRALVFFAPGK